MEARPRATGQLPSPTSPASVPVPRPHIFRAHPQKLTGVQAMLPLRNRNKCPVNTPLSAPKGLNMQKGVLLGTPIQSIAVPMGVVGLV